MLFVRKFKNWIIGFLVGGVALAAGPRFWGMVTGESTDVVETALKNPDLADLGIKQGDTALRKAEDGDNGVGVLLDEKPLRVVAVLENEYDTYCCRYGWEWLKMSKVE